MKLRDLTFQYVEDYMETFGEEPAFLCFLMDMRDDLFRLQFNSVEGMKKQVLLVWREVGKQKGLKNTAPDKVPDSLWTYFVEAKSIKKKATRSKSVSSKSTTVTTTVVSDKSSSGVFDSKVKSIQNFELKPLPSFPAVNGISFHQDLVQYRTTALEKVKTHSFTNQQLLSLSNILLLSQSEPIEFLNPETSSQLYASITTPLFKDVPSFPSIEFSQIKAAFLSFSSNPDTLVFSDAMFTIARNTTDPIVQSLIHSFITLAQEITLPYIQNMSEMRIQTSFIHPLVRGILKHFPSLIPHCSNKFAFVDDHHIMHCWPDYRVDLYNEAGMYSERNKVLSDF
ncbi:hypothetical protein BD560DRAFT_451485 [Blakeslea trispora]|nr:hypothetical protein BD560DRAFT_451485 [Blakeslea trispora]